MALFKIDDRYPDYKNRFFDGKDIKGSAVYTHPQDEKIGSVHTVLVDEADRIRYLVVDTGSWLFSKKVLLPIGCCVDQPNRDRSYATDLTKAQVQNLPEYKDEMVAKPGDAARSPSQATHAPDRNRSGSAHHMSSVEDSLPVELSVPVEQAGLKGYLPLQPTMQTNYRSTAVEPAVPPPADSIPLSGTVVHDEKQQYPSVAHDPDHHRVQLYEERLIADKYQQKTGEVTISKRVETHQTETSLPLRKEKVIIEIESIGGVTRVNTPSGHVQNGESVHMDLYGEQANLRKEPVVYQEVNIRKEVGTDVVTARETLRREELDIQPEKAPDPGNRSSQLR